MDLAQYRIQPDGLEVNGDPVPGVTAWRVEWDSGAAVPVVTIQQHALVDTLEGVGIVRVEVPVASGSGARDEVLAWLAGLDPEVIEQQALDAQGWGSGPLAGDVIAVLSKLAAESLS